MEFRVLGPLEVVEDGRVLPLGGTKQRALFARLLLHANEVVSADALIDDMWGEAPPATAAKAVQVYVSNLRKTLGQDRLTTRSPGYVLNVDPGEVDLGRVEALVAEARSTDPGTAAEKLREAVSLWRGPPLADLAYESFAQADIIRLSELRLVVLEERIDADLALGRHADVIPELEALVAGNPLREQLRARLMLALYRAGRQADALAAYSDGRRVLVDELGLEPSPALQELERAILAQDASLQPDVEAVRRSILLLIDGTRDAAALVDLARPLAESDAGHELLLARVVEPGGADLVTRATAELNGWREDLLSRGVRARVAAFSSPNPAADIVRLVAHQRVELTVSASEADRLEAALDLLADVASDAAIVVGPPAALDGGAAVVVPFGAAHHDWAALELGAWLARTHAAPLKLLGGSGFSVDGRDASRLLADASLVVQYSTGIVAEPVLAEGGSDGLLRAAAGAAVVVAGVSDRWRQEGLGELRRRIAGSGLSTIFVRRGARRGGLAPPDALTRFSWSLEAAP